MECCDIIMSIVRGRDRLSNLARFEKEGLGWAYIAWEVKRVSESCYEKLIEALSRVSGVDEALLHLAVLEVNYRMTWDRVLPSDEEVRDAITDLVRKNIEACMKDPRCRDELARHGLV